MQLIIDFANGLNGSVKSRPISRMRMWPGKTCTFALSLWLVLALADRDEYMAAKLAIDRHALDHIGAEERLGKAHLISDLHHPLTEDTKVAFMFLLDDDLVWPDIWDSFFAAASKRQYSIYIHRANPSSRAEDLTIVSRWGAIDVPLVPNSWCALMGIEVALITAALQDPLNAQLVFIAKDAVPLKTFHYVHSQLAVRTPDTSKFCFLDQANHQTISLEAITNQLMGQCEYRDVYSSIDPRTPAHHQWVVLARAHATTIARQARRGLERWSSTWRRAVPDLESMAFMCSDESVPATALLLDMEIQNKSKKNTWQDLEELGVKQECLTLASWHNCLSDTELELPREDSFEYFQWIRMMAEQLGNISQMTKPGNLNWQTSFMYNLSEYPHAFKNIDTNYLTKLTQHGFMFARKFPSVVQVTDNGKRVQLRSVLPKLWDKVDVEVAERRVWSRVSPAGLPANLSHKVSLPRTLVSLAQRALASSQSDRLEIRKVGLADSLVNDVEVHNLGVERVGVRNVSFEGSAEFKALQIHRADLTGSASVDSLHLRNWTMEALQVGSVDIAAEISKVSKLSKKLDKVLTASIEAKDELITDLATIFLLVKLALAVCILNGIRDLLRRCWLLEALKQCPFVLPFEGNSCPSNTNALLDQLPEQRARRFIPAPGLPQMPPEVACGGHHV